MTNKNNTKNSTDLMSLYHALRAEKTGDEKARWEAFLSGKGGGSVKVTSGDRTMIRIAGKIAKQGTYEEFVDFCQSGEAAGIKLSPAEMEVLKAGIHTSTWLIAAGEVLMIAAAGVIVAT
jgi:hypothetical protein